MGLPTLLLLVQLAFGAWAAFELVRRPKLALSTIGQVVVAVVLLALAIDGLFVQMDVAGLVGYELGLEPSWVRPATIGLIVGGTALWMLER